MTGKKPSESMSRTASTPAGVLIAMAELAVDDPQRPVMRDKAVRAWLPLAARLAHRYTRRGEPADDLQQTAVVGLIKAVDRFRAGHSSGFVAYAVPTIIGEIKRYFRDQAWSVPVPRRLQDLRMAINEANGRLPHTLGRAPTIHDIATDLDISKEEVLEGLECARAYQADSLSAPAKPGSTQELGDTLGTTDGGYHATDRNITLQRALAHLTQEERRIVHLSFYDEMPPERIAAHTGTPTAQVPHRLATALVKLRAHVGADGR